MKQFLISSLLYLGLIASSFLTAQVQTYDVPYAPVSPAIDGHLDFIWSKPYWSPQWKDIITSEAGFYRTRYKALWDDDHLYFFFEVIDPDIKAKGKVHHERLFQFDNVIEVFLDPKGDQLNYYELQINALGTRWELSLDKPYKDGGQAISPDELDGLHYAIHIDGTLSESSDIDHAWYVEMRIPWSSLPDIKTVPPSHTMRANFSRVYQDDEDLETSSMYWLWQPMGEFNIHIPDRWGVLTFLPKD